ncbi:MAG: ATP-binding protein [Ginsengibacter sp.]
MKDLGLSLKYAEELITLSQQAGNDKYLRAGYFIKGTKKRLLGNFAEALDAFFKSAELAKKLHNVTDEADSYSSIADAYSAANNHENANQYYNKAITVLRQSSKPVSLASTLFNAGDEFRKAKNFDSALLYFREANLIFEKANHLSGKAYCLGGIGMVYAKIGKNDLAVKNLTQAIRKLEEIQDYYPICDFLNSLTDVYLNKGNDRVALTYALRSLQIAEQQGLKEQIADVNLKLSELYEKSGDMGLSLKYYKDHIIYRDSINNNKTDLRMADLRYNFDMSQKQIELNTVNEKRLRQRVFLIASLMVLVVILALLIILFRNNRQKQKAYTLLSKEKAVTEDQRNQTNQALEKLQQAQAHLIQTEKMASLGELTAGIAHEIQNPLNFVNNFSEVNTELMEELQEELRNGNVNAALSISDGIRQNEQKINHHGKRADAIVKGMMQHSQTGSGQKDATNVNALAGEYLKLSYHGLRAKDKSFNATMETDFDETLPKINIIPQDVGRLLLNLYNNAFYAVTEKAKKETNTLYKPTVWVSTRKKDNTAEIIVRDNGTGIPQEIRDKIFNPFFTTKPTGLGTGLGLSLSYDIIKSHGGTISVDSKEGEFTEFTIQLPYL